MADCSRGDTPRQRNERSCIEVESLLQLTGPRNPRYFGRYFGSAWMWFGASPGAPLCWSMVK